MNRVLGVRRLTVLVFLALSTSGLVLYAGARFALWVSTQLVYDSRALFCRALYNSTQMLLPIGTI